MKRSYYNPDTHKAVPIEPDETQIAAGYSSELDPKDIYRAMLAAAPEVPAGDGWLPISEAPKDGTVFLALSGYYYGVDPTKTMHYTTYEVFCNDEGQFEQTETGWCIDDDELCYWLPRNLLPPPPAGKESV